jgi:hypothetical protein
VTTEEQANLLRILQEHSWRGRCLRTWCLLILFGAFAALQGDWSATRFALTPVLIGGFEFLYWVDARSKRYQLRDIIGNLGYGLGRVFRHRNG